MRALTSHQRNIYNHELQHTISLETDPVFWCRKDHRQELERHSPKQPVIFIMNTLSNRSTQEYCDIHIGTL
jgi:hypothetical protein